VSCASPGNCVATGRYTDAHRHLQVFITEEKNGAWGNARSVPGLAALNKSDADAFAVSCASPGNCALTGGYTDAHRHFHVFVTDEKKGTWQNAHMLSFGKLDPGGTEIAFSMSCGSPGNCALAGSYFTADGNEQAFVAEANPDPVAYVADERGGWDPAQQVFGGTGDFNISGFAELNSVSCGSPANCAAAGDYITASNTKLAFVVNEVSGSWGNAMRVPGIATLATAGFAEVGSVSCASPGNCVVGGTYEGAHGNQLFVADQSTSTSTVLTLSAATARAGHEQTEKISVQVRPRASGVPDGTVTVKAGNTTVCVITLAGGKGACALRATQLRPGSYQLTAGYGGDAVYSGSASAARKLTVTR